MAATSDNIEKYTNIGYALAYFVMIIAGYSAVVVASYNVDWIYFSQDFNLPQYFKVFENGGQCEQNATPNMANSRCEQANAVWGDQCFQPNNGSYYAVAPYSSSGTVSASDVYDYCATTDLPFWEIGVGITSMMFLWLYLSCRKSKTYHAETNAGKVWAHIATLWPLSMVLTSTTALVGYARLSHTYSALMRGENDHRGLKCITSVVATNYCGGDTHIDISDLPNGPLPLSSAHATHITTMTIIGGVVAVGALVTLLSMWSRRLEILHGGSEKLDWVKTRFSRCRRYGLAAMFENREEQKRLVEQDGGNRVDDQRHVSMSTL